MKTKLSIITFSLLTIAQLAAGHGAIIRATGDQGGNGTALGIDGSIPRNGRTRNPFQQDTTRFRGKAADICGSTILGGVNDVEAGTKAVLAASGGILPQISAGGELRMTLHQINADGAGPYTCLIDSTGTGTQWQQIQVTKNVPGRRGRNAQGVVTDFPLNAAIPANQTCTGTVAGQSNVCLVRCQNLSRAGPFGGCVPVQMTGQAQAQAGNQTASTTSTSAAGNNTSTTASTAASQTTGSAVAAGNTTSAAVSGNTTSTARDPSTVGSITSLENKKFKRSFFPSIIRREGDSLQARRIPVFDPIQPGSGGLN